MTITITTSLTTRTRIKLQISTDISAIDLPFSIDLSRLSVGRAKRGDSGALILHLAEDLQTAQAGCNSRMRRLFQGDASRQSTLMAGPYATDCDESRQDRKVAAVSQWIRVP